MSTPITVGMRIKTLKGELDSDERDGQRVTPPGTVGVVSAHNHADHWDVTFPNGAWVVLTEAEMADPSLYTLVDTDQAPTTTSSGD